MDAQTLVSTSAAPVNGLGARFYFDPATLARGKEAGLDGFRFYMLGRGGVLGHVEAPVITSAFGYFQPDLVAKIWTSAAETMAPRDAARLHLECNAGLGRSTLAAVDELASFCDAAEVVIAELNPAALALYAGTAAEPLPDDLPGRAMQLLVVHRELRGSIHLAALVSQDLLPEHAHALQRPNDVEMFGWPADLSVPDDAAAKLEAAETLTNQLHASAYRCMSDGQRQAFANGVSAIQSAFES